MTDCGVDGSMILADYFYPAHNLGWDYARICGVEHAVLRLPEDPDFDVCDAAHWHAVADRLASFQLKPLVIEPLPDSIHRHIKLGDGERDACIEKVLAMFPIMERLEIRTLCFNFMAGIGWTRTDNDLLERGGALVTGFDSSKYPKVEIKIGEDKLWENYWYFIKAVLPAAEKHGIQLALHPDDPPVSPLGEAGRIMVSYEAIKKAVGTIPSPSLGVTFCQATFYLMGTDVFEAARGLRDKIHYIHFRNVQGNKLAFRETLHDNGALEMGKLVRLYKELDLQVPIRVDHVPTMPQEEDTLPSGYKATGKLFAIGYLKGLLENA